jgi:hypothetical protein
MFSKFTICPAIHRILQIPTATQVRSGLGKFFLGRTLPGLSFSENEKDDHIVKAEP